MRFALVLAWGMTLALASPALSASGSATSPCQGVRCLNSQESFSRLALELAPRVNLFEEVWRQDPGAVLLHGVVRDYLYWLKSKFKAVSSPADAQRVVDELKKLRLIDALDFVDKGGASDIDVASSRGVSIAQGQWGIRRTDSISLVESVAKSSDEYIQGWLPIEKLAMSRSRLFSTLGDGVADIYKGQVSARFPIASEFAKTSRARDHTNHPVLLSIRYLRGLIQNRLSEPGGIENRNPVLDQEAKRVIREATLSSQLAAYEDSKIFWNWLNSGIQKLVRKEKDPGPTQRLLDEFGVTELVRAYPERLNSLNSVVYSVSTPQEEVARNLQRYRVDASRLFVEAKNAFPGNVAYHGTGSENDFRSILLDGPIAGKDGYLWVSSEFNISYSENFREKKYLIRFPVRESARLIDLNSPEGNHAWKASEDVHKENYSRFMELFGADGLRLQFGAGRVTPELSNRSTGTDAHYIIRNAEVFGAPEGVYRTVLSTRAMLDRIQNAAPESLQNLISEIARQKLSPTEEKVIFEALERSPAFPPLDRVMRGRAFYDQVHGIMALMTELSEADRSKMSGIKLVLWDRLDRALKPKEQGGAGFGADLSRAITAIDSQQEIEKYLKVIPQQGQDGRYSHWTPHWDAFVRVPTQAWLERRVLPTTLEKTGDIEAIVRFFDGKGMFLLRDGGELAEVASRSFERYRARTLPVSDAAIEAFASRNLNSLTGDEILGFLMGFSQRGNLSASSREKLLSFIQAQLKQLPEAYRTYWSQRSWDSKLPSVSLGNALLKEFLDMPEARSFPRILSQWAIEKSDSAVIEKLLSDSALRKVFAREMAMKGVSSVDFFSRLRIELAPASEREFLKAALDRGVQGFLDYRGSLDYSLTTNWHRRLSQYSDLMADPAAPAFFRFKLNDILDDIRHINEHARSVISWDDPIFKKIRDLVESAAKFPNPKDSFDLIRSTMRAEWKRSLGDGASGNLRKILDDAFKNTLPWSLSRDPLEARKIDVLKAIVKEVLEFPSGPADEDWYGRSKRVHYHFVKVIANEDIQRALGLLDQDPEAAQRAFEEGKKYIRKRFYGEEEPSNCEGFISRLTQRLKKLYTR